jgi:2,3-bisphosphoglycerate-independent phosphoglycerate mutase
VINELSAEMHKVLAAHPINQQRLEQGTNPANVVLLRGCGSRIAVTPFAQLHGLKAALVAPTKIIAGVEKGGGIDR